MEPTASAPYENFFNDVIVVNAYAITLKASSIVRRNAEAVKNFFSHDIISALLCTAPTRLTANGAGVAFGCESVACPVLHLSFLATFFLDCAPPARSIKSAPAVRNLSRLSWERWLVL
jgi:hypothetical protein